MTEEIGLSIQPPLANDARLKQFLEARTDSEEDRALYLLLEDVRPNISSLLRRKALLFSSDSDLADDLFSSVMVRAIERLRLCKQHYLAGTEDEKSRIHHFPALVQTITTHIVHEHLRRKYPRRASLQNKLLYVIRESKSTQGNPRFALWQAIDERLCGFFEWQNRPFQRTDRHTRLSEDPLSVAHQALPGETIRDVPLVRVLDALLSWLQNPAEFDEVVGTTAQWQGIQEIGEVSLEPKSSDDDTPGFEPVASDLTPEERTLLSEYFANLWEAITELPAPQIASLLLNLRDPLGRGVLGLMPALGVASLRQIAEIMEIPVNQFAALWPHLPLEDKAIAQLLGCPVPQIAIWRLRARKKLQKKMEEV